jgi:hypothetical protein
MNTFLAQAYGTAQPQPTADAEKVAQAELFAKLAADNNIDLSALQDDQVVELWNSVFAKTAGESAEEKKEEKEEKHEEKEEKHEEKHEEKEAAADAAAFAEWLQTKEAQAQWEQTDFAGRQMAHAYVDELKKMAAAGELNFTAPAAAPEAPEGEVKEAKGMPPMLAKALGKASKGVETVGKKITEHAPEKAKDVLRKHVGSKETLEKVHKGVGGAALGAGAAAAAGGAAYAHSRSKKASALTEASAMLAIEKAAAAEFDRDEAIERVSAVLTLGFNEDNTKVAAAFEFPQAKEIRALELLEAAGYPVTWEEPSQ